LISGAADDGGDDSISQKIVEVLNSVGSKIQKFKDFITGDKSEKGSK